MVLIAIVVIVVNGGTRGLRVFWVGGGTGWGGSDGGGAGSSPRKVGRLMGVGWI